MGLFSNLNLLLKPGSPIHQFGIEFLSSVYFEIFEVKIKTIEPSEEGFVDLSLIVKNTVFWARLTKTSVTNLKLTPGRFVYALFKSTAIEILGH